MSPEFEEARRRIERLRDDLERQQADPGFRRITVNKRTHKVRFENETESEVTIVIEQKEEK